MQSGAPSADWLSKASPEDLLTHGKQIFSRIGQLDQTYRERFVSEVRSGSASRARPRADDGADDLSEIAWQRKRASLAFAELALPRFNRLAEVKR
jgi:hypothetical protein